MNNTVSIKVVLVSIIKLVESTIPVGEVTDDKVKMVTFSLGF